MTLDVASDAYVLGRDDGEPLWFSGGLLTYKATAAQTNGLLALAEVRAPKGPGRHRTGITTRTRPGPLSTANSPSGSTTPNTRLAPGRSSSAPAASPTASKSPPLKRFLILVTPAGFVQFTRVCGDPATAPTFPPPNLATKDTDALLEAARAHGIEIVPSGAER